MLVTLARLRDLDGVRVVASCRTFDLNNDPRLSTLKVDRRFQLRPLDESQVEQVLAAIGIDPARLLPAHRELLSVPLHLRIYAQVVADSRLKEALESFRTLQELYEALWQKRVEAMLPSAPSPSERIAAIYRLVEAMRTRRQLAVPVAVLDDYPEAANYLEQVGFIRREGSNWLFLHQTLFDYCYARRFVGQGRSLSQEILRGPQGLFERSQMVQVLAYLRGADETAYYRELTNLLFAEGLRVHLHLLLIAWFGSIPNPTAGELRIARRLVSDADDRAHFLQAAGGNKGWFDLLNEEILPALLQSSDETLHDVVIRYLSTLIQHRTETILNLLHPYLGKSEAWDSRITFCLSRLDDWRDEEALRVLCDLLRRGHTAGRESLCFYHLAQSNPAGGCQALRVYLDRRLDDLLAQEQAESQTVKDGPHAVYRIGLSDRLRWEQQSLGEYAIGEVMKAAVHLRPEAVIEHLLPWFVRAVLTLTEPREREDYYPSDALFAWGWYDEHISEGAAFARRIAEALRKLARTRPSEFRAIAAELAAVESLAVQRVLTQAYLSDPETYADDIFEYVTGDPRRLNIGEQLESPHYDSCRLYAAAFRHVDADRRAVLEQLILDLQPTWEKRSLRYRGLTQLRFLKSVPRDLLSETARGRLGELERKFPDFELRPPEGIRFFRVGPPIEPSAQAKMSDEAWLGAMRKYDDSTAWDIPGRDPLRGGAVELSRAFAERVKEDPERFYRLAHRFDEPISLHYVTAAISGLAESDAPAEWVFDLVRQFAPRIEGEFRRDVCRALEKRAEADVPDDLLDIITDWALHDPDPAKELRRTPASDGKPYYDGDPHCHGDRGAAVQALCRCALTRTPPQVERAFQLLEQFASDLSTAVRTCVIESLGLLLQYDASRALSILERALEGHPRLLQSPLVHRFLYWTYYRHFPRIRPHVEALLSSPDDATRQAGARLACLAAFQYPEASELVEQVMHGDAAMRRGGAQVYARNLENQETEDVCREQLLQLMDDPDDQVRAYVGECFKHLCPEHLDRLRPFIEQFLGSPALMSGAQYLVGYLAPLAADAPDLALMVTERILDVAGSDVTDIRRATVILERDLVRLPLTVYTHASDSADKSWAMDLFERLLLLGSRAVQEALADWDRR